MLAACQTTHGAEVPGDEAEYFEITNGQALATVGQELTCPSPATNCVIDYLAPLCQLFGFEAFLDVGYNEETGTYQTDQCVAIGNQSNQ